MYILQNVSVKQNTIKYNLYLIWLHFIWNIIEQYLSI